MCPVAMVPTACCRTVRLLPRSVRIHIGGCVLGLPVLFLHLLSQIKSLTGLLVDLIFIVDAALNQNFVGGCTLNLGGVEPLSRQKGVEWKYAHSLLQQPFARAVHPAAPASPAA